MFFRIYQYCDFANDNADNTTSHKYQNCRNIFRDISEVVGKFILIPSQIHLTNFYEIQVHNSSSNF